LKGGLGKSSHERGQHALTLKNARIGSGKELKQSCVTEVEERKPDIVEIPVIIKPFFLIYSGSKGLLRKIETTPIGARIIGMEGR